MLDVKWIVNNPKEFNKHMDRRGCIIRAEKIIKLYELENKNKVEVEGIRSQINSLSKKIGKAKKEDRTTLISEASILKNKLKEVGKFDKEELREILIKLPNILQDDVPLGKDENGNIVIRVWNPPVGFNTPEFNKYDGPVHGLSKEMKEEIKKFIKEMDGEND